MFWGPLALIHVGGKPDALARSRHVILHDFGTFCTGRLALSCFIFSYGIQHCLKLIFFLLSYQGLGRDGFLFVFTLIFIDRSKEGYVSRPLWEPGVCKSSPQCYLE